jgi:hypothetical protein
MDCTGNISSVKELLERVESDTTGWSHSGFAKAWFRGVTDVRYELVPRILRNDNAKHEFDLTKKFRLLARGYGPTPETDRLDEWLFLMQHHGAPTRLLDWSENPLVAAFFAAEHAATEINVDRDAAIYALDPVALNKPLVCSTRGAPFPYTWVQGPVLQTIKIAFGTEKEPVDGKDMAPLETPIAIYPPTIHARIASQRGCFTLHGSDPLSFEKIVAAQSLITSGYLKKYRVPKEHVPSLFRELSDLGITYASLFPDLDGLSKELRYSFRIRP